MTIPAWAHFDGTEIWSDADWNGSTWREDAMVEACNASSESNLVGSGTIVSATSPSIECISTGGNVVAEVKSAGGPYLSMDVYNRGAMPSTVTRLDVKADILYRKAVSVLRTGDSDDVFEESMEYVHTLYGARRHANLVDQYNRCSGSVYTFRTNADIVPCSIVRLRDDVFTGLDVNVLVTAMKDDDRSDFRTYTAVGITGFSLDDDVYSRRTSAVGGSPKKGASAYEVAIAEGFVGDIDDWLQSLKGEDGRGLTVNVTSSNGSIFRMDGVDTVLSCQVLENGRDMFRCTITDTDQNSDTYNQKFTTEGVSILDLTDPYQAVIESTAGTFFKNNSGSTTLICKVYQNGVEVDATGSSLTYTWTKTKADGTADSTFSPTGVAYGSIVASKKKAISISHDQVDVKATFFCSVS